MTESSIESLNQQFALSEKNATLKFKAGVDDMPVVAIKNKFCSARISLQGANLLSFINSHNEDLIWVSDDAVFAKGKSVRGGIPICWPWFGTHETNTELPAHGFARTALWYVQSTQQLSSGETQIVFILKTETLSDVIKKMWPFMATLKYTLTLGAALNLELTTINDGDKMFTIGEALHTYFNIGDITTTKISGLDGVDYLDKPDDFKRKHQQGDIVVCEEVDRVYPNTADEVVINNNKRKITIQKTNSLSTIVWNPWKDVANKMGDLGPSGYLQMLCVESGNVAENVIALSPSESHTLSVVYAVE